MGGRLRNSSSPTKAFAKRETKQKSNQLFFVGDPLFAGPAPSDPEDPDMCGATLLVVMPSVLPPCFVLCRLSALALSRARSRVLAAVPIHGACSCRLGLGVHSLHLQTKQAAMQHMPCPSPSTDDTLLVSASPTTQWITCFNEADSTMHAVLAAIQQSFCACKSKTLHGACSY